MKGIIVDKKSRYAVVLTGDGSFVKIHNKAAFKIGYEVEFVKPYQLERSLLAKVSSIAAVFLFTLGLSYGVYSYSTPYSYVDIDINPSIELTANIYDIIIKTETFNEDGEKLLQKHKLNFKKLDAGIAELVGSAIEQGYLKAEAENAVLLTIASKDEQKEGKLEKNMQQAAIKALGEGKVDSDIISQQVSAQKHDSAKDKGVSPGKYNLIEKARAANPELKLEELEKSSVKEIMEHVKVSRKEVKEEEKLDKNNEKEEDKQDKEDNKQNGEIIQETEEEQETEKQDTDKEEKDKGNQQDKEDKQVKEDKEEDQVTVISTSQYIKQNNEDSDSIDEDDEEKSDEKDKKPDKDNNGSGNQNPKNKE